MTLSRSPSARSPPDNPQLTPKVLASCTHFAQIEWLIKTYLYHSMDDDEQYPSDAMSEEAELSAHGLRIEGEDEEEDLI